MFIWAPVYTCTHWLRPRARNPPFPPHLGSIYEGRALLVSQDGRHLSVTPWLKPTPKPPSMIGSHPPETPAPPYRHLERHPVRRVKTRVRERGEKGVGSVSANPHGSSLGKCWLRQIPMNVWFISILLLRGTPVHWTRNRWQETFFRVTNLKTTLVAFNLPKTTL